MTLLLSALVFSDAVDPTDAMSFVYAGDAFKVTSSTSVEGRDMAGGRVRVVRKAGRKWSANPILPACTPEQAMWLRAHEGAIVCVRDHQGTKLYGFYAETPVSESTYYRDVGDVELSFVGVSWSEAV
jgi:hypothetical protein